MHKYSYETILRAVGRVLDDAEARSFAIRDEEQGLLVETFDSAGKPSLSLNFDVAELAELVDHHTSIHTADPSEYDHAYVEEESALTRLLKRRELVGAGL